jgi:hypothetical protein
VPQSLATSALDLQKCTDLQAVTEVVSGTEYPHLPEMKMLYAAVVRAPPDEKTLPVS